MKVLNTNLAVQDKSTNVFLMAQRLLADAGLLSRGLLVALSGGVDSVCLLRVLHEIWRAQGGVLEVAHVDHGLRPDSGEDARFCQELASTLRLPFHIRRLARSDFRAGESLQSEGRRHRRAYLRDVARHRGLDGVALGHHADDQAETVLFRLARGTGLRGAAGMVPWDPPFVRPFLGLPKSDLELLAQERGWAHREDPSNSDPRFPRNRIRKEVIPQLRAVNAAAVAALGRFARLAVEDDGVLTEITRGELARLASEEPEGLRIPTQSLRSLAPPIRRRLYLAAWAKLGCDPSSLQAHHLEAVEELLEPGRAHRVAPLPGPGAFAASYGDLWALAPGVLGRTELSVALAGPGRRALPALGGDLVWEGRAPSGVPSVGIPGGADLGALFVRTWRPGDRVRVPGGTQPKVKDLLMGAHIPRWRRQRALVVGDARGFFGLLAPGRGWGAGGAAGGSMWLDGGWFPEVLSG